MTVERFPVEELAGTTIAKAWIYRDASYGDILTFNLADGRQVSVVASNYIGAPSDLDVKTTACCKDNSCAK